MLYAPPSRPHCRDHSNYISREVQVSSLQLPIMSSLLGRNALLIFYSLTPSVSILPLISETKFLTHPKVQRNAYFCIFILFYFEYLLNLYVLHFWTAGEKKMCSEQKRFKHCPKLTCS